MPRINVSPTDAFTAYIDAYAEAQSISRSRALLDLAAIGLYLKTGKRPPEYAKSWGGESDPGLARRTVGLSEIELDRLEVMSRGWPPLADDD